MFQLGFPEFLLQHRKKKRKQQFIVMMTFWGTLKKYIWNTIPYFCFHLNWDMYDLTFPVSTTELHTHAEMDINMNTDTHTCTSSTRHTLFTITDRFWFPGADWLVEHYPVGQHPTLVPPERAEWGHRPGEVPHRPGQPAVPQALCHQEPESRHLPRPLKG